MADRNPTTEHGLDSALNWFSKVTSTVLSVALVYPMTTALVSVATVALVVVLFIVPPMLPKKAPEASQWRLQQMMQAVQNADARVRTEHPEQIQQDPEFRGVWDTFRDQDKAAEPPNDQPTESSR